MIEVRGLNKTYERGRNAQKVLRDLSFTLPETGFVCIIGPSGCGKTSLLNAVGGLDTFNSGTVTVGDRSFSSVKSLEQERNNSFGYIFQNYYLLPEHSAAYNVYLGLHALKLSHREKIRRVREALEAVDMGRYARRAVGQLSGGQQQRVAIARAMARRPRVIFADEPTGNLDEENTLNICTLLRRISRTSLVVMVTHEEKIARFFADRIISLSDGRITGDSTDWQRTDLRPGTGKTLYAGDYNETRTADDRVKLRVLHEEGAAPVELTLMVLKDRVVLKLEDSRMITCSGPQEEPLLAECSRPTLTLESVDNLPQGETSPLPPDPPGKAGRGITAAMASREALSLLRRRSRGLKGAGVWIFLAVMTVLTSIMVGDYLELSSIDPKDYILTDSHVLELQVERGPELPLNARGGVKSKMGEVVEYLEASGLEFDHLPYVTDQLNVSSSSFLQMEDVSAPLPRFSYALTTRLREEDLILGRMPESYDEVVIDRWVLDEFLAQDGVVQNNISSLEQMLGAQLTYQKKEYAPTIVGICDRGDPTLYFSPTAMVSVGIGGFNVIPYSQYRAIVGEYITDTGGNLIQLTDDLLKKDDCLFVHILSPGQTGAVTHNLYGGSPGYFNVVANTYYGSGHSSGLDYSTCVVRDDAPEDMLRNMSEATTDLILYLDSPEAKAAMKEYLARELPENLNKQVILQVTDANGDAWARYYADTQMKADARTIVTATVIALCMVMLYLLQRTQAYSRIGVVAVYRLLGIPGRKLVGIFTLECLLLAAMSILPAAALTWLTAAILGLMPSLDIALRLPWQAAGLIALGIAVYYLFVSLLPLWLLLQLPPARLAGKYDL